MKLSATDEALSPLLERAKKEAELARNQIAHGEAEVCNLRGAQEELQSSLHCLASSKTEITRLQEFVQKDKPVKRLISYDELWDSAASGSDDSENNRRRQRRHFKKSRASTAGSGSWRTQAALHGLRAAPVQARLRRNRSSS